MKLSLDIPISSAKKSSGLAVSKKSRDKKNIFSKTSEIESFIVLDARYLLPLTDEKITPEKLRQDPLYFMLAHEISHVALGHALYLSVTLSITEHGPTGLAGLTVRPLVLPLQHWARQAVLSADRGVLVATGQYDAYRNYLMNLLMLSVQWDL